MTQIQLTDAQAVILSAACAREDGMVFPVTANLKGGAVGNVCKSLLKRGLIEEVAATDLDTVWRHDGAHGPITLRATPLAYTTPRDHGGPGGANGQPAGDGARARTLPPPQRHQTGGAHRDAPRRGRRHHRRDRGSLGMEAAHGTGRHGRRAQNVWPAPSARGF
jgi:hypothetical protein